MISYNKNYFFFIPFFLVLSINEVQATIASDLQKRKYTNAHNMKTNKHSFSISKGNKSLDNNRKKRKYHTSVDKENNIDRLQSSPEYKNFLTRLSVKKKDSTNIYKKLFEEEFNNRKEKIQDNKTMIQKVDERLKQIIDDYNKMLPQGKKFMFI